MIKAIHKRWWPLDLCFLVPVIIMAIYFAYRQMAPFGNRTILTVDLGQQYVDFFAYFKHAVTAHPSNIVYSFSKALGGNMIGTWSYYLMSPINWLVLFFSFRNLPVAILIIILIKYGLAGLSFGYLIKKTTLTSPALTIAWSTAYALNGWIIANQLNLMWLDGLIILPGLALGIRQLVTTGRGRTYLVSLTLILIINYYIAYMLCLFSIIDFIYLEVINYHKIQRNWIVIKKWVTLTITSFGLAAWLLLPTEKELGQSKGRYLVTHVKWRFEYFPPRMLAKLINGSFNFEQLPKGTPNIFLGSLAIIGYLIYVLNPKIKLSKRLANLAVSGFLILSMCWRPLDLLWHAMQFPIWYPYRFSFIFCFWVIITAVHGINSYRNFSRVRQAFIWIIIAAGLFYIFTNRSEFPFVSIVNLIIGSVLITITLITVLNARSRRASFSSALLIITIAEMGLNAFSSLNRISYVPDSQYVKSTAQLSRAVKPIRPRQRALYRIGKNFYRSKDDALNADYPGDDNFSSDLETSTTRFMGQMGQPEGEGFVEYANGTLLSDRILGMKYFMKQANPRDNLLSRRPDLGNDRLQKQAGTTQILRTRQPLPIMFTGNRNALRPVTANDPVDYQSRLYDRMTSQQINWFHPIHWKQISFRNLRPVKNLDGAFLQKRNPLKPGQLKVSLPNTGTDPVYLTLGSNLNSHNVKIRENGKPLVQFSTYRNTVIVNLDRNTTKQPTTLTLEPTKSDLWMENFKPFKFNQPRFRSNRPHARPLSIQSVNSRKITGHYRGGHHAALITTIPDTSGWHLSVDGRPHRLRKIASYFIGAKLPPGRHSIRLSYWPPGLNAGIAITIVTVAILIIIKII